VEQIDWHVPPNFRTAPKMAAEQERLAEPVLPSIADKSSKNEITDKSMNAGQLAW
jgi:hypothetical protein